MCVFYEGIHIGVSYAMPKDEAYDALLKIGEDLEQGAKAHLTARQLQDQVFAEGDVTGHAKACDQCRDLVEKERRQNPLYLAKVRNVPRLLWGAEPAMLPQVSAKAGPIECIVHDYGHEFHWFAETGSAHMEGYSPSLLEAQLAAESAAQAWLREGLAAFGDPEMYSSADVRVGCHVTVQPVTHKPGRGVVLSIIPGHSMDLQYDAGSFGRVYFDHTRILDVKPAS